MSQLQLKIIAVLFIGWLVLASLNEIAELALRLGSVCL